MNLKEIKEDFESKGYQDGFKWMRRCQELIERLEDAEEALYHWCDGLNGRTEGHKENPTYSYNKKWGDK